MGNSDFNRAFSAAVRSIATRKTSVCRPSRPQTDESRKNARINSALRAKLRSTDILEEMGQLAEADKAAEAAKAMEKYGLDTELADQVSQKIIAARGDDV